MKFNDPQNALLFEQIRRSRPAIKEPAVCPNDAVVELVLNISGGCNLTCPYCFAAEGKYQSSIQTWMSPETAMVATSSALKRFPNLEVVKLFGGEPFMNLPAMEGVLHALQAWPGNVPQVVTVTNGTIANPRAIEIAKKLNIGLTVSIDGPADIHNANRKYADGRGSFERIASNIDAFRRGGLRVAAIESVYSPLHREQGVGMLDLVQFLDELFSPPSVIITPITGDLGMDVNDLEEFSNFIRLESRNLMLFAVKNRGEPLYSAILDDFLTDLMAPTSSMGWCGLGVTTVTVSMDGSMLPCYTLLEDPSTWTISKSITALDPVTILPSEMAGRLAASNPRELPACEDCDIREVCHGCPGASIAFGGSLSAKDSIACSYRMGSLEGVLEGFRVGSRVGGPLEKE